MLIIACSGLRAQTPYLFDFLRNDASARSAAMGGAFGTVVNDPVGMFYNPALIYTVDTTQISFTFLTHVLDITSGSAAFTTDLHEAGKIGIGVIYTSYGSFDRSDRTGQQTGSFVSGDMAAQFGWSMHMGENIIAGLNAKAIFSTIDSYNSMALALDGGLLYNDTAHKVQMGVSVLNLGTQLSSFDGVREPLPLDLRIGISHNLRGLPLLIALNFNRLFDEGGKYQTPFSSFSIGGEFTIAQPVRLRFGYNNRIRQDVVFGQSRGLAGLSAGIGLIFKGYRLDYGFNSLAGIGAMHRLSINTGL